MPVGNLVCRNDAFLLKLEPIMYHCYVQLEQAKIREISLTIGDTHNMWPSLYLKTRFQIFSLANIVHLEPVHERVNSTQHAVSQPYSKCNAQLQCSPLIMFTGNTPTVIDNQVVYMTCCSVETLLQQDVQFFKEKQCLRKWSVSSSQYYHY